MRNLLLEIHDRNAFRKWLFENGETERECWLHVKRGEPTDDDHFWYIDAVEEALCFGWIDSIQKVVDGVYVQRFCKRQHFTPWTELDKERVRRLQKLGLMTDAGLKRFPKKQQKYILDPDIEEAIKTARILTKYRALPPLYRRIRTAEIASYKESRPAMFKFLLTQFIEETRAGHLYGEWDDYGRLLKDGKRTS